MCTILLFPLNSPRIIDNKYFFFPPHFAVAPHYGWEHTKPLSEVELSRAEVYMYICMATVANALRIPQSERMGTLLRAFLMLLDL